MVLPQTSPKEVVNYIWTDLKRNITELVFANKTVAGSVNTLCNPPYLYKLTNLQKFEIVRPSGSRENNEKPITQFA